MPEGHIGFLVERILEVVDSTPDDGEDFVDDCVRANAVHIAEVLREDADLREKVDAGDLEIVPALRPGDLRGRLAVTAAPRGGPRRSRRT